MAYVITQNCCNDASCLSVCPVGCIHPTPEEPEFATAEMLYIDPATCIDCGACADVCPVDAILPATTLSAAAEPYAAWNEEYFQDHPIGVGWVHNTPTGLVTDGLATLRVGIVGSGPAAWYCAKDLLAQPGVEVEMFDRLPTPFGLIRHGVAPDHPATKAAAEQFRFDREQLDRFRLHLNVEIGVDLSPGDLAEHHHAVIYAHGAADDRRLNIRGEDLPGSIAATEFVAWYNGHPDFVDSHPDLTGRRVIIVGNGNVALDIARLLLTPPDRLARTDMADRAITAFEAASVEEVVILGRRGPADAAFSTPELLALTQLDGVEVVVDAPTLAEDLASATDVISRRKLTLLASLPASEGGSSMPRVVLRFSTTPVEFVGTDRVTGLNVAATEVLTDPSGGRRAVATDRVELLEAGLVVRSVGFRGREMAGVPFDPATATVPHRAGRVLNAQGGRPVPGMFTAGWIKRGPSGVIGTNRVCARETVESLLHDFVDGSLPSPAGGRRELMNLVHRRQPAAIDRDGWNAIDSAERSAGAAAGRPRRKLPDREALLRTATTVVGRRRLNLSVLRRRV